MRMRLLSAGSSAKYSTSLRTRRRVSSSSGLTQPRAAWLIASRRLLMDALRSPPRDGRADPGVGNGNASSTGSLLAALPVSRRQLEVGDRTTQVGRQLRQVADRLGGLPGTLRGLAGDLADHAHRAGDVRRRRRLLLGGDGDVLDEGIECVGHALDLGQRGAG